jgi:phage terminase large subunit-like protein
MAQSLAEHLAALPSDLQDQFYATLSDNDAEALLKEWQFWGRPEQHPPDWLWRWWLIVTGRGWGKNRTAAEWVIDRCELFAAADLPHLVGLIGQNNDDVKGLQIGGISGLREVVRRRGHRWVGAPGTLTPKVQILRDDGTWHTTDFEVHTAEQPEGPRGRNFHTLWIDELAAYKHKTDAVGNTVFTNAELALRGTCPDGDIPRAVVTTTPKPIPVIRDLLAKKHGPTQITRGSMYDNRSNLPDEFIAAIEGRYRGTRLYTQEVEGAVIDSVEGALWSPDIIHRWRVASDEVPQLSKVVIAVDPSGSDSGDECGIVVAGLAAEPDHRGVQHVYILSDLSMQNRPEMWAQTVTAAYHKQTALCGPDTSVLVVAEVNFGAALVKDVIKLTDRLVPFEEVRASRGKRVRAEPIATMYDPGQGRIHHVGVFAQLEEQQCFWTPLDPTSPDRLDALVWAVSYLIPTLTVPPADYAKGFAARRAA